jgi:solute carrier family 25 folate transporter 32
MSHERSTPSSPGTRDFATPSASSSPESATSKFAVSAAAGFGGENGPLTVLEKFAMARSDSSFHALAGAAGGFMSGVVTCPLDVIKTKLQAQGGFRAAQGNSAPPLATTRYSGMLGTARVIWREEGLRGMYRGLGPIILGYLPTWAVWFTVYGKSKEFFGQYNGKRGLG